jgi:hypothetical protein
MLELVLFPGRDRIHPSTNIPPITTIGGINKINIPALNTRARSAD